MAEAKGRIDMEKTNVRLEAIKFLNNSMYEEDYIGSAVFTLFEEALQVSNNKTQLTKTFIQYCNDELGRSYLIGDAIYTELKDFIKLYKETVVQVDTEKIEILVAEFEPTMYHIYTVKTSGKYPVRLINGGEYLTEFEGDLDQNNDMGWFNLNTREYNLFKANLKKMVITK